MSYQDAIEILSSMDCEDPEVEDIRKAVSLAVDAMQLHIPKTIKCDDDITNCPACNKYVVYKAGKFYCECCGQALVWEDA